MGQILENAASNSESPDSAESFWDVLDKAQNAILRRYPDRDSIAQKMALKELESIAAGSQPEPEKIREIRAKFPFVQSTASGAHVQTSVSTKQKTAEPGDDEYEKGLDAYEAEHYMDAFNLFLKAANQGNAKAQMQVAQCFADGIGTRRNRSQAESWYRKLAEKGDAEAQYRLARYSGYGVEAVEWYLKAAEQGHAKAQLRLGECYLKGYKKGCAVKRDFVKALKWIHKAAEQRLAEAQCYLGWLYCHGDGGVAKNPSEAVKWYTRAAEQGLAEAQFRLGYCYFCGLGVEMDKAMAAEWYCKAADQNHEKALFNLYYCFWNGIGEERNHDYGTLLSNKKFNKSFPPFSYYNGHVDPQEYDLDVLIENLDNV